MTQIPQLSELTVEDILRHWRWSPWQRHPKGRVIKIPRHNMNVKVRRQIAQEHIVDMTRLEGAADRATDMLNIPPVKRQLRRCQITQVGDVPAAEDYRRMPRSNRPSFQ
jgi:hypothetical protein